MATQMLLAGIPIPIVSRRLDHRRVSTTLDFYANVTPAGDRFAANALQAVMSLAPESTSSTAMAAAVGGVPSQNGEQA